MILIHKHSTAWTAINSQIQNCPKYGDKIAAVAGFPDAVCRNCGYKDPCCE